MRALLWSSIDNAESRDLDQIEYAEELPDKGLRLLVGIADVDALIKKNSALDKHAMANSTSVYTGIDVFPMLPSEISTGLTSLNEGGERVVLVVELVLSLEALDLLLTQGPSPNPRHFPNALSLFLSYSSSSQYCHS